MRKHTILFLDIDGTIITPEDEIEQSTKEAIKQVQQQGLEVFLATGRPLHEINEIGEELQIESFIGYNGAFAIHKGKEVCMEPMEASTVEAFLNIMEDKGHEAILYTNEKNLLTTNEAPVMRKFINQFHLKHNERYHSSYRNHILGISLMNLKANDVALYEEAGIIHLSPINVEGFKDHAFDVIRDKVHKGFAVSKVLDFLGLSKETAIAFGDGMNDKEMLSFVGEGFAMGNAQPELLPYAKHQTTDVRNSGVFNGLKSLGLVE
ncbi:Cof-type HAD-IIB family hydrolase [Halalkalibacter alkalisediminis]|uniref:Cof-type HAD-IIB family hydrolase n=1 Tax=Halalkalibacter alkalisediminis TaxID=935616 RepID=A0ABV6NHR6_9BACI|nr:HAD family hydrolase [Halalkalibacter alkalisediminis]